MPTLPLREYFWLAIILILAVAFVWDHYSGVQQGVAKQVAVDARVAAVAIKAAEAQKQADLKTSSDAVAGLKNELQNLKDHPPAPAPVRLCVTPARRAVPAPPQPAGGITSPAPAAGELPGVPAGTGTGIDVGSGVQRIAEAADVVAARDRACLTWASGIAK